MQVTLEILELLLTYCRFHRASGRSDKVSTLYPQSLQSLHPCRARHPAETSAVYVFTLSYT